MPHYHFLDESGDPGLGGSKSSSSHFVLAMVQLPQRIPLPELATTRQTLHLPPSFEFKYYNAKPHQKIVFFRTVQTLSFCVRVVAIDKSGLGNRYSGMSGQAFAIEFITHLTLRSQEADLSNGVLVIDDAIPAFRRALRIRLSNECRQSGRTRPFKKIVSAQSHREDGIQLADMIAGAIRQHAMGIESNYYKMFENKVIDYWKYPMEVK